MSTRDRRVTLALKWHHLDHLSVKEIQDRFEAEGIGSYARSTIRRYLNEQSAEEVKEQIRERHADVRLQIAEREERLYQRAREAEAQATEDRPIVRVVPKTERVSRDRATPQSVQDWEVVDPDDPEYPEWATERDIIIRFTEQTRSVEPGGEYPVQAVDGSPRYTKEFAGLQREQPDQKARAMARQEQSAHLEAKGEILGVYETDINLDVDGDIDHAHEFDPETEQRLGALVDNMTDDDE